MLKVARIPQRLAHWPSGVEWRIVVLLVGLRSAGRKGHTFVSLHSSGEHLVSTFDPFLQHGSTTDSCILCTQLQMHLAPSYW